MTPPKRALLLVGSPRAPKSNSEMLGAYLMSRLAERGLEPTTARVGRTMPDRARLDEIAEAVEAADLVVIAAPLYVDCVPAQLTRVLEDLAERRRAAKASEPVETREPSPGLTVILNCGFPEAHHNNTALRIYETFARQAGMTWLGGVGMGMGEMLDRRPLDAAPRPVERIRRAIDLAAESLADGRPLPEQVQELIARPSIPRWLYNVMADRSWRKQAKRHGTSGQLDAQPYET